MFTTQAMAHMDMHSDRHDRRITVAFRLVNIGEK